MKTTNLTAIAIAIVFSASATLAQTTRPADEAPTTDPTSIVITFRKALENRGLYAAMCAQVNERMFAQERPIYNVPVRFRGSTVIVRGTYKEWTSLFDNHLEADCATSAGPSKLPLREALKKQSITRAMREQLTPNFLNQDRKEYVAPVKLPTHVIFVTGSRAEWNAFFKITTVSNPLDT